MSSIYDDVSSDDDSHMVIDDRAPELYERALNLAVMSPPGSRFSTHTSALGRHKCTKKASASVDADLKLYSERAWEFLKNSTGISSKQLEEMCVTSERSTSITTEPSLSVSMECLSIKEESSRASVIVASNCASSRCERNASDSAESSSIRTDSSIRNYRRPHSSKLTGQALLSGVKCYIAVQPKPLMRFRYMSEYKDNRAAHKMLGVGSTSDNVVYPTVTIEGWSGAAVVVVSLVQDEDHRLLHPHSLVEADSTNYLNHDGFVRKKVKCDAAGTQILLNDLSLIRNKKDANLLPKRYEKIDPFRMRYSKLADGKCASSHAVRLCVEVYFRVGERHYRHEPLVSNVIKNSGAHQILKIINVGFCTKAETHLREVMILCDKVDKDDIDVEFVTKLEHMDSSRLPVLPWRPRADAGEATRCLEVFGQVAILIRLHPDFLAMNHRNTYVRLARSAGDKSDLFKFSPPPSVLLQVEPGLSPECISPLTTYQRAKIKDNEPVSSPNTARSHRRRSEISFKPYLDMVTPKQALRVRTSEELNSGELPYLPLLNSSFSSFNSF